MDNHLYKRRKELNLTLEEVGQVCGVGKSTVRKWETGEINNMGRDKIVLLANALQVSPLFILQAETNERFLSSDINFKDRLKELRLEFGYSGEELGKKIGVSRTAIANYESGLRNPKYEQLYALADVFNVDIDYLLGRSNTKLLTSLEFNHIKYLMEQLNEKGKNEAIKRIQELTYIPEYQL